MAKLGNGRGGFGAGGGKSSRRKGQEPGNLAQQAGLAGAVRSTHQKRAAGLENKVQALKQRPSAPLTGDVAGLEANGEGR